MAKVLKALLLAAVLCLLLLSAVALALQHWLRSDDFRARAEARASAAAGVPVTFGQLAVEMWPLPAIVADYVHLQTEPALTLARVEARPVWRALAIGRLEIATLVVRNAVLPQEALAVLGAGVKPRTPGARADAAPPAGATGPVRPESRRRWTWPQRAVLDQVTWIDAQGRATTVNAQLALGADGLVEQASFHVLRGRYAGARGEAERKEDHWPVQLAIGGGTIAGRLQLSPGRGGLQVLQGQLRTEGVELTALTRPARPLAGKLQAQTTLRAEFGDLRQLPERLTTQTRFSMDGAVVQGLDLARAVRSLALPGGSDGQTRLERLSGQLETRGSALYLTQLVATSGALTAKGQLAVTPQRELSGRIVVELSQGPGGLGVPLAVSGTVERPRVSLARGASLLGTLGPAERRGQLR